MGAGNACPQVQEFYNAVWCSYGTGDPYCDTSLEGSPDYYPNYYLNYDCGGWSMPSSSTANWSQEDFMCFTCYWYYTAGGIIIGWGIVLELPLLILSIVGACFKPKVPGSGMEMGAK